MAIKIIKADEVRKVNNLIFVIYGLPGLGKTSTAFTASKPFLFDFDNGVLRAAKRGDSTPLITNWSDINGLSAEDLSAYDTIIVDTVGRALEVLADSLIKNNPKYGKADGTLSLQGFGALSAAFKAFISKLRGFGKDIILLAHAKEDKDGDTITYRIDAQGSAKQEIYKICDMMGYLHTVNNSVHLSFNPNDAFTGKNCANVQPFPIPAMDKNNHYLADIIKQSKDYLNALSEEQLIQQRNYDEAIELIDAATDLDTINGLIAIENIIKNQALKNHLHNKATELGFIPNSEKKCYENRAA